MANVNVRIDAITKAEAEAVFSELGLTPSTAINLFYKQVIRTQSIPFKLKMETPNRKTKKVLKEVERMEKHPDKYKKYDSVEELMEDLNSWHLALDRQATSKKDFKLCIKRGLKIEEFINVVNLLRNGDSLPEQYKDHQLKSSKNYKNCWELHIQPDWLLIYKYTNENVILLLVRTGSHSDLFKK